MLSDVAGTDQAQGMRRLSEPRPVHVIAVASGKGGVGKTNVSVNLAVSLAASGKEVMLLDADLGLANVDVLLGFNVRNNLSHVLRGECSLEETIIEGPHGVKIIPGASGIQSMADLPATELSALIGAFNDIGHSLDVLIVDTAAGVSENVVRFSLASQEIVVVVCNEPASITDAYALIKILSRDYGCHRFRVLANMAQTAREGRDLFATLMRVTERFLDVSLDYMGHIPYDEYLKKAVQKRRAVVDVYPGSRISKAFKKISDTVDTWPVGVHANGQLQFFLERIVQAEAHAVEGLA